jgi:hypothetical protein
MRPSIRLVTILGLCLATSVPAVAAEGDGLSARIDDLQWSRWQGRLALGAVDTAGIRSLRNLSLMGDYYFDSRSPDSSVGGFRATSGLIVGSRTALWAGRPAPNASRASFSVDRRLFGDGALRLPGEGKPEVATLPYLGLGYTGLAARGSWRFNADLGLVALAPGQAVRLGRVFGGAQNLDDVVRDLRLSPVLQFGVSYSF